MDHTRAYGRVLFAGALAIGLASFSVSGCGRQTELGSIEVATVQPGSFTPLTGVLMQHNDLARTGANLNETILTTSNVNTSTFGKLTSLAVSGQVYAQPLYVSAAINGKNVVFIATESNKVYAYNADSPWDLLWSRTDFEQPWASTACANTQPLLGISSTPVIDPASNTIYVVNKTNTGTTFKIMLHVLNMTTGADKVTPVDVSKAADGTTVSVNGTGDGSSGGKLLFDAMRHQNRVGLTLSQGVLSIGFASHCDQNNYHGWLLRFDTTVSPPRPLAPYVTTPNTGHGGFWMGGEGFSVDANGDIYFISGDGRSGLTDTTGSQLANAFVRLTNVGITGTPTVGSWFMPSDVASLDTADADIGSSGPLLIPGTSLLVGGGKNGIFYVLNRTTMGGFRSGSPPEPQIVQRFSPSSNNGQIVGSPVWWESPAGPRLYVWPGKAQLAAFAYDRTSNLFNTTAVAKGVDNPTTDPQGGQLSLSANGSTAGTGIVWGTHPLSSTGGGAAVAGVLYAYNAENVAQKLWDSNQVTADHMASATKYVPPTVANGKVYVGTFSDKVEVYGLFQAPPVDAGTHDAGAADAGPLPMLTCGTVDGGAAQPTSWSYVFTTYFAGTTVSSTAGHCQECHTADEGGFTCGADKDSCYAGLVASGKITPDAGTNSPIGDPNRSPLAWFDNPVNPPGVLAFMPSDLAVRNARAVAAVCGWVAAGARNDKANGQTCAGAYECTSGACVDGVCCSTACTGTCTACSNVRTGQPNGTCAAIVSGGADGRCTANPPCGNDGTCDGASHCHVAALGTSCGAGPSCTNGIATPATICNGSGSCLTPIPQACAPFICGGTGCSATCTTSADCAASAQCVGGACVGATGGACTLGTQCASGACVDGVCCSTACTGTCTACSNAKTGAPDGTCAVVLAGVADSRCGSAPPCGNTGLCTSGGTCAVASSTTSCRAASCSAGTATAAANCDGAGACPAPVTQSCSPYACGATACKSSCTADADCVAADYCGSGVCVAKKSVGSSCTGSSQCGSGFCCNSLCVDAQTDGNNCGSCGNVCGAGSSCAAGACSACSTANGLIDNFEDNDNVIRPLESRNGLITTYADTRGSTITPATTATFTSATPGHGGTGRAAHISGHVANLTGTVFAGLNLNFKNPRATYNPSRYTGFTFYAKKGSSSASGAIRVKVPDHNTDAAGGVCTSCGNDFGTNLTLTTTWTQYTVRFATLTQETGGSPRPPTIDATQLYGIKFQSQTKNATYDIWIDDLTFICN